MWTLKILHVCDNQSIRKKQLPNAKHNLFFFNYHKHTSGVKIAISSRQQDVKLLSITHFVNWDNINDDMKQTVVFPSDEKVTVEDIKGLSSTV